MARAKQQLEAIVTKNIFATCGSCSRELVMLEEYLRKLGKKVTIKVISDTNITSTTELLKTLGLK